MPICLFNGIGRAIWREISNWSTNYSRWSVEASAWGDLTYYIWSAITLSCEVSWPISLRVALWKLLNYILEHARLHQLPYWSQNLTTKQLHFTRVLMSTLFYWYMLIIQQNLESTVKIQSKSILIYIKTFWTCTENKKTFIEKASAALQTPLQNRFPNSPYSMRLRKRFISTYVLW